MKVYLKTRGEYKCFIIMLDKSDSLFVRIFDMMKNSKLSILDRKYLYVNWF